MTCMENDINPLRTYLKSNYQTDVTNHENIILFRNCKRVFFKGSKWNEM